MSLFWGFCPNLLNSPQIHRLLHCCHVLSDELSPVNVGGTVQRYLHTYIDALLTIFEEKPGLCSQWQSQVFHCGTVTGTGNYSASFSTISWPFLLGTRKLAIWSRKLRLWITQIQIEARWHIMHVTAPWRGGRSAHCTLWHWIFWNFAKATRQALALCSLPSTWGEEGDTGVTSINNYPDTAHRGLGRPWGRHDVTTGDGCVCCTGLPGLRAGLRGDLGHVFGRNDT